MLSKFDRVVSVGMMEHVGIGYFDLYFQKIRGLLKDDGYAHVHCIGRMLPPGITGPFIRKYIFPGAYVPSLSKVFAATERTALWVSDMEVLRLHYHYTIRHWRTRLAARRDEALALTDERFCRMWEFYLAAVELDFLHGTHMVFQILLPPARRGADRAGLHAGLGSPVPRRWLITSAPTASERSAGSTAAEVHAPLTRRNCGDRHASDPFGSRSTCTP